MPAVISQKRFIKEALEAHNKYRKLHGVPALEHDEALSDLSEQWAEHLALNGKLEYSNAKYQNEDIGQNILRTKSNYITGELVTDLWYKEESKYAYDGKFVANTGHFTQIVWKSTRKVGFGFTTTEDGQFYVVVNYSPAGNFKNEFKDNVMPANNQSTSIIKPIINKIVDKLHNTLNERPEPEVYSRPEPTAYGRPEPPAYSRTDPAARPEAQVYSRPEPQVYSKPTEPAGRPEPQVYKRPEPTAYSRPEPEIYSRPEPVRRPEPQAYSKPSEPARRPEPQAYSRFEPTPYSRPEPQTYDRPEPATYNSGNSRRPEPQTYSRPEPARRPEPELYHSNVNAAQSTFIREALDAHNTYRQKHCVDPLVHNTKLSEIAQNYANHLANINSLVHSTSSYEGKRLGENLAYAYDSSSNIYRGDAATKQWYDEIKKHNFGMDHQSGTGHFTQVVWKSSKEVGFGVAQAKDGSFYAVANYHPAGNIIGHFLRNVPRPLY